MTRRPIDPRVSASAGDDHEVDVLRDAFAHWASGVAVMTARDDDDRVYAMTIAALTPVSLDPPLVLACLHNDAPLASVLLEGARCAVSILTEGQKRAATTFADRFAIPGDLLSNDDLPIVVDAAATLSGVVRAVYDGGDHRIVVVGIGGVRVSEGDPPPLLYWRRAYRRIAE